MTSTPKLSSPNPPTPRLMSHRLAVGLVLAAIVSVQLGAAVAKGLFDQVTPTTMTWLRLLGGTLLLVLWVRPRLRGRSAQDWWVVIGFGTTLSVMNWSIYQSLARIPIGLAVTIEFLGPLAVALLGSRRPRDLIWVVLAGLGVALLGGLPEQVNLPGVLFALAAGTAWAAYIWLSVATGARWQGLEGLVVASLIASVFLTPVAFAGGTPAGVTATVLSLALAIGLLSSVIPYSLELHALRTLPPSLFGILMSLEPAVATLAGMLVLGEFIPFLGWIAMACVIVASIGATRSAATMAT